MRRTPGTASQAIESIGDELSNEAEGLAYTRMK
jgi:hypothetical protein